MGIFRRTTHKTGTIEHTKPFVKMEDNRPYEVQVGSTTTMLAAFLVGPNVTFGPGYRDVVLGLNPPSRVDAAIVGTIDGTTIILAQSQAPNYEQRYKEVLRIGQRTLELCNAPGSAGVMAAETPFSFEATPPVAVSYGGAI